MHFFRLKILTAGIATILVIFHWGNFFKFAFWSYARFSQFKEGAWSKWPNVRVIYAYEERIERNGLC